MLQCRCFQSEYFMHGLDVCTLRNIFAVELFLYSQQKVKCLEKKAQAQGNNAVKECDRFIHGVLCVFLQAFRDQNLNFGSLPAALRKVMVTKFADFDKYQLGKCTPTLLK